MTLIKDSTGKYVSVNSDNVSVPSVSTTGSDNQNTNSENQTVASSDDNSTKVSSESSEIEIGIVGNQLSSLLKTEVEKIEIISPEIRARRREAQFRTIDRILRTGGMDSQQADHAMVEIRRVLKD